MPKAKKERKPQPSTKPRNEPEPKAAKIRVPWTPDDGLKLRAARLALGLSMKALAQEVGCCGSRVRELELDVERRGPPSPALAQRLGEFFSTHKPAQAPMPINEKPAGKGKPKRAKAPAEGVCPSEEEMAEEERLAAEAGHPAPDQVTAQVLNDEDERDLTA